MKLFIDDLRTAPEGWVLARTITEAIRILSYLRCEEVSLDHDIAFMDERGQFTGKCSPENYTPVARYIVQMPWQDRPHTVHIHTANPDGAEDIQRILNGYVEKVVRDTTYAHEWAQLDGKREVQTAEG